MAAEDLLSMIHPTCLVGTDAEIGEGVDIGPFTVVYDNVTLGEGAKIESHCSLGSGSDVRLVIGKSAVIRSHSVIYGGSSFGEGLDTGHHVTIRSGVTAGRNLRVGSQTDIQGLSEFGDFVRLHSDVFVAQYSKIGDFVWIFPKVMLANDPHPPSDTCTLGPTIRDGAALGAMSLIMPGTTVGRGSLVAAGSTVTRDVPPYRVVRGAPARDVGPVQDIKCSEGRLDQPYPWWKHFRRGFPEDVDFSRIDR
jgi:acetyltransferase-like isoleucine patch superfamily enzyme